MSLRAPSDPKLAAQMLGWWPAFSEARRPEGKADSATPERLAEIAAARAAANSAARVRAEAKRERVMTAQAARDAAMRNLLTNSSKKPGP